MTRNDIQINMISNGAIYVTRYRDGKFVSHFRFSENPDRLASEFLKAIRHFKVNFGYRMITGTLQKKVTALGFQREVILYVER